MRTWGERLGGGDLQADRCPRKDERSQLVSAAAGSTGQEVKL